MNKIIFIGNSENVLENIRKLREIEVICVIYEAGCECSYNNTDNVALCDYVPVYEKEDMIAKISSFYDSVDFAIMYNFGVIIPKEILDHLTIYNFHPGDLRTNRGSSPINWSILLQEKTTKMSLYRICESIDLGDLILEHECVIYQHDVPLTLRFRLEGEIASMILEMIEKGSIGVRVEKGTYRKRLTEKDYTIHEGDSRECIYAKIRSQYEYSGAIVLSNSGSKQFVKSMAEYDSFCKDSRDEEV